MIFNIALYLTYIAVSSTGMYKIKVSESFLSIDFFIGFFLYGLGFLIWIYILKLNPISIAFPIAASSLIIALQFIGFYFLDEPMKQAKIIGMIFIMVGIIIVYKGN
jgi:drug/metabolite transporter (DMT)-like permease